MGEMEDGGSKPSLWSVRAKLEEEDKVRLEGTYGVRIRDDVLNLSCNIALKYFDEKRESWEYRQALLQRKAADLLERACSTLRSRLDGEDEEEKRLDADIFMLYRSFVELREIRMEKDRDRFPWLHHVEREFGDAMDKCIGVLQKWEPFLQPDSSSRRRDEENHQLQMVHQELLTCLQQEHGGLIHSEGIIEKLDSLVTLLSEGIHQNLEHVVTVGPHLIAQVASPLTGVPASWLLRPFTQLLRGLEKRLSRREFGKEFPIRTITRALLRGSKGSALGPIGSFLFLCGSRGGGPALVEALAIELFDDQDSVIHFDLSEFADVHSASCLIGFPTSQGELSASGLLAQAVKSKPSCVVFFSNIDVAHASVVDILIEITSHGRLTDGQGGTIDFTKTLIVMMSRIGSDQELSLEPSCFEMGVKRPIKELLDRQPEEGRHFLRSILPCLEKVRSQVNPQLFEQLDDIVVFPGVGLPGCKASARLQLRDIAMKIGRRLIIYPSEDALNCILGLASWWTGDEKLVKAWLDANLVPMLHDMCAKGEINDNDILYIDTLVGTEEELSYRVVKREEFVEDQALKEVREHSAYWRALWRNEKERIKRIYLLRRRLYELNSAGGADAGTDSECVAKAIRELVGIICLMINGTDANHVADIKKPWQSGMNEEEMELSLRDVVNKRAKKGVEYLKANLRNRFVDQAIDAVAGSLLRIIDVPEDLRPHPVPSLLLLGLTTFGKEKLVEDLAEQFATDDGASLLIQINLSDYEESDSLSRLMDIFSRHEGSEHCGRQSPEDLRMRPCSIILLDQVEKAHISVFSAILSVLDCGIFRDHRGRTMCLSDTVVIITSDVGNKKMFAGLFGHTLEANMWSSDIKQGARGFRRELLSRVDEMLIFDPLAGHDQPRRVARLSMMDDPLLHFDLLLGVLFFLVKPPDSKDWIPQGIKNAVKDLSKALVEKYDDRSRGTTSVMDGAVLDPAALCN